MLIRRCCFIFSFGLLLISYEAAHAQVTCDNPNSCANLGCLKTCEDKWQDGKCLGGYCPKGLTADQPPVTSTTELHLYNVSPALELEIRKLIDKGL